MILWLSGSISCYYRIGGRACTRRIRSVCSRTLARATDLELIPMIPVPLLLGPDIVNDHTAADGVMTVIRARHGEWAIGRGDSGIRYRAAVQ
jgi:hypothetical protein